MKNNTRKSSSELYRSTHEYYAKYRPSIPEEVINVVVEHFDVKPTDRVLDIGCGTGQVALAMDGKCAEMVCLDLDPKMLEWAKRATKDSKTKLVWLNYAAEDLEKIREKIGSFKIATICRAFHWMNQEQVLKDLNGLIDKNGGITIFGDGSFWTGKEEWQQAIKKVVQKYLGEERRAGKTTFKQSNELWEDIITRSSFKFIKKQEILTTRHWDVESIVGYLFSTSFASPNLFGDQLHKFKKEIETILLTFNPKGVFQEKAIWSIILGSRKPH